MYVIQCTATGYINYHAPWGGQSTYDMFAKTRYFLGEWLRGAETVMCSKVDSRHIRLFQTRQEAMDCIKYDLRPSNFATITAEFEVVKVNRTVELAA